MIVSALSFVGVFFMTRYLGTGDYGTLSWVLALVLSLNAVSDLGFTNAHIKRISEGRDINDCVSTYAAIELILTGAMVVITLCAVVFWAVFLGGTLSSTVIYLIVLFIIYCVLVDLAGIAIDTYIATTEMVKSQIMNLLSIIVRIALVVFVCVVYRSLIDVAYAYVASGVAMAGVALFLLYRDHFKWRRPKLFKVYLEFALPISVIAIVNTISLNIPTIIIGVFSSSDSVAFFQSSWTLLSVLGLIGAAVSTLTYPMFSKMFSDGDIEGIRSTTKEAERYISMLSMPVVVFLVVFPTQTATVLFGASFAPAGDVIRVMALSTLFVLLNQVCLSQILATNHPGTYTKLVISSFIVNVALLLILIPYDLLGSSSVDAAIAVTVSNLILLIATKLVVKHITGTTTNMHIFVHVAIAAITGIVVYALSFLIHFNGLAFLLLFASITLLIFAGIMWAMKEVNKKDVQFALDLVNPKKMEEYIRSEVSKR